MSTIAIDNFKPSAGGTSFGIEGIAKAVLVYDQTVPSETRSDNISSTTDQNAGDFTWAFTNNFDAADWAMTGTQGNTDSLANGGLAGSDNSTVGKTTSGWSATCTAPNGSESDRDANSVISTGNLA